MIALALLVQVALRPTAFGDAPIQRELLIGEKLERSKKGIERTFMADRQPIGFWFSGKWREDVEEAIWISPELVSRWLGWQQSREGWGDAEVVRRWKVARDRFNGKLTFVVRLSAFPKIDPLEGAGDPARNAEDLDDVRGVLTYDVEHREARKHVQTYNKLLHKTRGESASEVLAAKWDVLPPFDEPLKGTFGTDQQVPLNPVFDYGVGDYSGCIWLVQCEVPTDFAGQSKFELQVVTAHKSRKAYFDLEWSPDPKRRR